MFNLCLILRCIASSDVVELRMQVWLINLSIEESGPMVVVTGSNSKLETICDRQQILLR
jgi:hypothetical protein